MSTFFSLYRIAVNTVPSFVIVTAPTVILLVVFHRRGGLPPAYFLSLLAPLLLWEVLYPSLSSLVQYSSLTLYLSEPPYVALVVVLAQVLRLLSPGTDSRQRKLRFWWSVVISCLAAVALIAVLPDNFSL